ncbi:MAG: hypothetical protein J7M27_07940 [Candidatus Latescibacteria bacterium]|nr:hypothetical protein [Candidatus Latescibacterota bacterium]
MASVPDHRLNEIIQRIAEVAEPERVILFGSSPRGKRGPNRTPLLKN